MMLRFVELGNNEMIHFIKDLTNFAYPKLFERASFYSIFNYFIKKTAEMDLTRFFEKKFR